MESFEGNIKAFLSAEDLFNLRKSNEIPVFESVNEKSYIPDESDDIHVESLLKDKKTLLEAKNVARIGDLIQAEWKPNIKKAITSKLKGRTQHMGCPVDGKIALYPEEIIFLLENGNLELSYNGIPLSTESAYARVFAEDMAVEKYQVYSHLSRLGFIVVHHQKHIDVSHQEKLHANNKCRCKKRKKNFQSKSNKKIHVEVEDSSSSQLNDESNKTSNDTSTKVNPDLPKTENCSVELTDRVKKNFELLIKTSEINAKETAHSCPVVTTSKVSSENDSCPSFISNNVEKLAINIKESAEESRTKPDSSLTINSDNLSNSEIECSSDQTNAMFIPVSVPSNSSRNISLSTNVTNTENIIKDDSNKENLKKIVSGSTTPMDLISNIDNDNVKKHADEQLIEKECKSICITKPEVLNEKICALEDQEINHELLSSGITDSSIDKDDIEISGDQNSSMSNKLLNSQNSTNEDISKLKVNKNSDSFIELDDDDDESNSAIKNLEKSIAAKLKSDDDETSDSDVLSLYANSDVESEVNDERCEVVNDDSIQSVTNSEIDDVMVVEVNKVETEPVAIIDLSSDEESNTFIPVTGGNEDDDVLIIDECRSAKPSRPQQGWFTFERNAKLKKEVSKKETKVDSAPSFPFPNLFKKRVVCLPRPPSNLLPYNIHLNKEAYTIDLSMLTAPNTFAPTPRVWNSWRDLQERNNSNVNIGSNDESQRRFPCTSSPNVNFQSFPRFISPSNLQSLPFPNISSNIDRFDLSQTNTNMLYRSFEGRLESFNNSLIGNVQRGNSNGGLFPTMNPHLSSNRILNPYHMLEESKRNLMIPGANPWASLPRNENYQSSSLWKNTLPNDGGRSSNSWSNMVPSSCQLPNPWGNMPPNETNNSPHPWRNMLPNEINNSPNPWRNMPPNETNNSPNPWMTTDYHENQISVNPNNLSQNPTNFFNSQHSQRNFSNPQENLQPPLIPEPNFSFSNMPIDYVQSKYYENPYPCDIPKFPSSRVSSWREIKVSDSHCTESSTRETNDKNNTETQDIDEVLWSKEIRPLIRPSHSLTLDEALKSIQKTTANLCTTIHLKDKSLPEVCSLEISFDVYLPKTPFRRSCPSVPHHRIIVTRSSDPFPKLSDIYCILKKFKDSTILQFAIVDNGDIAFYSFNNVNLPMLLP